MHPTTDDALLCFSRRLDAEHSPTGVADVVVVVVNLDAHAGHTGVVHLDLAALGLEPDAAVMAHDVLSGETYVWGSDVFVSLDPVVRCAHVVQIGPR